MKIIFLILCLTIVIAFGFIFFKEFPQNKTSIHFLFPLSVKPAKQENHIETISLFVPYWALGENNIDASSYTFVIYFSIVPNENGIDMTGDGYKRLQNFLMRTQHAKKKFLTVQMTDNDFNSNVLRNKDLQGKIINQSLAVAKENGFDAVVLDFEMSGLPFESLSQSITNFHKDFADKAHKEKLLFFATVYGDVFYRLRPYNVSEIVKQTDGIFIMAYDFHKAGGDPGANFPLSANKDEDYDFKKMTDDFLAASPLSKITVVFGMFGYDWKVNEKGQSIAGAESLSLNEINKKFLDNCLFQNCKIARDSLSAESEVTYTGFENTRHDLWFEDMQSVAKKKEFLKSRGIFSTAFWAYSYF